MPRPFRKCPICSFDLESEKEKEEHFIKLALDPEHFKFFLRYYWPDGLNSEYGYLFGLKDA